MADGAAQFSFPKEEEKVLAFWREIDAFKRSQELNKDKEPFAFFDGPPFATGLPHYGHLLAGTIKDIVTRFAHSTGHSVERRFGWDCHGLPVEYEVDKALGITGKADVLAMGIDKYNEECRSIVMRYATEWRQTVERAGRWIDFDNDYKTLNVEFMESVWWVFKTLFDKGQVYRGSRVMPFSTACNTPVSNFEAQQNYKDVSDPSVVVSFPLLDDPTVSFLAWTTTPWTLPSNLALCVNPAHDFIKFVEESSGNTYIMLEKRLVMLYKDPSKAKIKILDRMKGSDLKGIQYVPLFNYYYEEFKNVGFRILNDGYVDDAAGTGIVHQAPAFGEDDYRVCIDHGVITADGHIPCPVNEGGKYFDEITHFKGIHAVPSWFVRVQPIVDKMLKNNAQSRWVPGFVQEKRFANWIANARDWNISRSRYWGTPIPIWATEDFSEMHCVGSLKELEELSGCGKLTDIHRHFIDGITFKSAKTGKTLRRIEDVFDCWFESGSMPYAQQHYPFENEAKFKKGFPADFISEGLDQTRGWFYTLLVLSTHLFDAPPAKNQIVSGLVLASDGKKMSKRLKNYPEATKILDAYGADALRLYLINSPVVRAETLKFKEEGVKEVVTKVFLPWYNAYKFFVNQTVLLKKEFSHDFLYNPTLKKSDNVMDRWMLASCQSLIKFVRNEMENYRLYTVVPRLLRLIDELTNWYVRFNRRRLKGENGLEDGVFAMNTLFEVLYTLVRAMAPFTPFLTETMYQTLKTFLPKDPNVVDDRSVHFLDFPEVKEEYFDDDIERAMSRMQAVIELGRTVRERKTISLKTPLKELVAIHPDPQYHADVKSLESYIVDELNVRTLVVTSDEAQYGVKYKVEADLRSLGAKLKKDAAKVKNALPKLTDEEIKSFIRTRQITIEGHDLGEEDLTVVRYFESSENSLETNTDKDVLILLDVKRYPELEQEGLAREVINRVQRLRKKAGLEPTDMIHMYYEFTQDLNSALEQVIKEQEETLVKVLKRTLYPISSKKTEHAVFVEEAQEVNGSTFNLSFVRD
ncbi:isoleucine--tRNA ligase [Lunasporangiospora selenospora]|uniref:Isoleucine--tRNA ligase, cytoplasmic n=1 Tax=Lunasporangiospora selenospora TaxID=979761 RepID=A0A9P6FYL0_9FUNG|nr:isoleucine--tRNA ligase [Lunasporangiospora selenospora]